ncbi:MAG: redoxin domain-containing protein [Saprospiraceae bacterium]
MKRIFIFILLCNFFTAFAQKGYEIKVKLDNYAEKQLLLGYHFGEKQYIKDTTQLGTDGFFTFKGDKPLDGGMYLVIMLPDKNYFQMVISDKEQNFTLATDAAKAVEKAKFKNAPDNELFFGYMNWLTAKREGAEKIKEGMKKDSSDIKKLKEWQDKLDKIDKEVKDYQWEIIKKNPTTTTALLLKGSLDVPILEFPGEEKDVQEKKYWWYKAHYFDHLDFKDTRLIRLPILPGRVDYYLNKYIVQHPDTICEGVDRILQMAKPNSELYRYFLIQMLNTYAKSNIVGHDAIYVHMALNYYAKGECPWIDKDELDKIVKNAQDLEPTLIGKVGQDLTLEKRDGTRTKLYDIKTPYTILLFWAPDCSHCQKEMPDFVKFAEKWSNKGKVTMIGVCNKVTDKVKDCWSFIDEHPGMNNWLQCVDTYLLSKYVEKYYIKSTPQIYILDKDKKIIMKKIAADQLDSVMDDIIKTDQARMEQELKDKKK